MNHSKKSDRPSSATGAVRAKGRYKLGNFELKFGRGFCRMSGSNAEFEYYICVDMESFTPLDERLYRTRLIGKTQGVWTGTMALDSSRRPALQDIVATLCAEIPALIEDAKASHQQELADKEDRWKRLNAAPTKGSAFPELVAALQAEQDWRDDVAAGRLGATFDYERTVGNLRRAALVKAAAVIAAVAEFGPFPDDEHFF